MRDWRLQSPVKVIEKVKAMLLAERTGAEWEILEGKEWEEETQAEAPVHPVGRLGMDPRIEETGVLVPGQTEVNLQLVGNGGPAHRVEETGVLVPGQGVTIDTGGVEQANGMGGDDIEEKREGKSGWMKLKSR